MIDERATVVGTRKFVPSSRKVELNAGSTLQIIPSTAVQPNGWEPVAEEVGMRVSNLRVATTVGWQHNNFRRLQKGDAGFWAMDADDV